MKINNLQELKPIYIHDATSYSASEEISLIDIAMILIRRKVLVVSVFIVFIALGVASSLFIPKIYTFSTTIEIGSHIINGSVRLFETPQALMAKLEHSYIPQTLIEYKNTHKDEKERYNIKLSVPSGSNITLLEAKGTEDMADTITNLLQLISQKAIQDHKRIYDATKQNFIAAKMQSTSELALLNPDNIENTEKIQAAKSKIESYNSQLVNLRNTREILPPMRSIDSTGTSKNIIIAISVLAGTFLGIFSAFFAEFMTKIKERSTQ